VLYDGNGKSVEFGTFLGDGHEMMGYVTAEWAVLPITNKFTLINKW